MKQWWFNLAERERQLLLVGAASILIGMLYWGIWAPLQHYRQASELRVKQLQQQFDWMQQQAPLIHQLAQSKPSNNRRNIDIASAITLSSQTQKMALKRLQPQGDNALVELDIVNFDQLIQWLALLEQQYNIQPQQIELQALPTSIGNVQVKRLLLGRNKKE